MTMNDAILLAHIGLMLYGIAQHFRIGDDFWFHPTGNIIGAIGVAVVAGAMFGLSLQDEIVVLVAVALALYWLGKYKQKDTRRRATFEQIFETVEVEPIDEPKVEQPFMWQGA